MRLAVLLFCAWVVALLGFGIDEYFTYHTCAGAPWRESFYKDVPGFDRGFWIEVQNPSPHSDAPVGYKIGAAFGDANRACVLFVPDEAP